MSSGEIGHTISYELIEVDARNGYALVFEPPLTNTAHESMVLDYIGLERNENRPKQIRAGGKDYLPVLWTGSCDSVRSNIPLNVRRINNAMEEIAELLGNNSIFIPIETI